MKVELKVEEIEFVSEDQQTAVAQAAMLREIAAGRYKPRKPEEVQRRFDSLLTYLVTGKCEADDETKAVVTGLNAQLKTALKPLAA